jgi:hypothetical protein
MSGVRVPETWRDDGAVSPNPGMTILRSFSHCRPPNPNGHEQNPFSTLPAEIHIPPLRHCCITLLQSKSLGGGGNNGGGGPMAVFGGGGKSGGGGPMIRFGTGGTSGGGGGTGMNVSQTLPVYRSVQIQTYAS